MKTTISRLIRKALQNFGRKGFLPLEKSATASAIIIAILSFSPIVAQQAYYTGEMRNLIKESGIRPLFENYVPDFNVRKERVTFHGPDGDFKEEKWFIMDGRKYIAVYSPGQKPSVDFFAYSPLLASDSVTMPVRHHNSTLLGTRLTTSVWYDMWAISGDSHEFHFSGGGDSITLTESQEWTPGGKYRRNGKSVYHFTFRCDPYFGYILIARCSLDTDDPGIKVPEFINFMPPDVSNPWPWKNRYAFTVYSDNDQPGYQGYTRYSNNLAAGNLADEVIREWGKGFSVRNGGLVAMADSDKWSPALFRKGDCFFSGRICDVWLDIHNNVHLPQEPGDDGFYHLSPMFIFVNLPPALSSWLINNSSEMSFKREKQVMIRLGVKEDFEDQPLPLDYTRAAMTKGFWEEDFIISGENACSGNKSLMIDGRQGKPYQVSGDMIHCPSIPLEPNATYLIEAFVKVEGDSTKAFISADYYEWSLGEQRRLQRQLTYQATKNSWQRISLVFTAPGWDPFVDLRFNVNGKGRAWFDDFIFTKLPAIDWTIRDTVMAGGKPFAFRVWIPPGSDRVRGLILAANIRAEEVFVINPAIREAAAKEHLAIIKSDSKAFAMFDITKGEDIILLRILKKTSERSGHPEIESAPWITFGHSTAGHFAKNLAYWKPDRTIAVIYFKSGQFSPPPWAQPGISLKDIPVLAVNGQFEEFGPHGNHPAGESWQKQWLAVRDTFMILRGKGWPVSLIVSRNEGHSTILQKELDYIAKFIIKATEMRLDDEPVPENGQPHLTGIKKRSAVLSDTTVYRMFSGDHYTPCLSSYSEYPRRKRAKTFWHPDMEMAEEWVKYHQSTE